MIILSLWFGVAASSEAAPPVEFSRPDSGRPSIEEQFDGLSFPEEEKNRILGILERQKQALETEDMALYALDLVANPSSRTQEAIERFFADHDGIRVNFLDPEIRVEDKTALVVMLQTTSYTTGEGGQSKTVMSRVLWKLVKIDGTWKIYETKILEKP